MLINTIIYSLDLFGVFVFALSGALVAIEKNMDILGMLVLAIVTAVGGGTLRSILMGNFPILFFQDSSYFLMCIFATTIAFFFYSFIQKCKKPIILFDAMDLGLFMALGVSIAFEKQFAPWVSIIIGILTASFGGVIRDILSARVPLIFRSEFYATACLIGGCIYFILVYLGFGNNETLITTSVVVFMLRMMGVYYGWRIPRVKTSTVDSKK